MYLFGLCVYEARLAVQKLQEDRHELRKELREEPALNPRVDIVSQLSRRVRFHSRVCSKKTAVSDFSLRLRRVPGATNLYLDPRGGK